jgi:hypothetical protein
MFCIFFCSTYSCRVPPNIALEVDPVCRCAFQCHHAWPPRFASNITYDEHTGWPPETTRRNGKRFQQWLRRSRRGQANEAKSHANNADFEHIWRWSSRKPCSACGDSNGRRLKSSLRSPRPRRRWEWRLRRLKSTKTHSTGGSTAPGHQGPRGKFSVWRLSGASCRGLLAARAQLPPLDAQ